MLSFFLIEGGAPGSSQIATSLPTSRTPSSEYLFKLYLKSTTFTARRYGNSSSNHDGFASTVLDDSAGNSLTN